MCIVSRPFFSQLLFRKLLGRGNRPRRYDQDVEGEIVKLDGGGDLPKM